jgi:hypothetical protein
VFSTDELAWIAATPSSGGGGEVGAVVEVSNFPSSIIVSTLPTLPTGANTIGAVNVNKTALVGSAPATAVVDTSSAQAVGANGSRKGLVITNVSSNNVFFGVGATAELNSGIALGPFGTWEMDEHTFSTAAINAIASASASPIAIQEYT